MRITVLSEHGYKEAMLGLSLSYGKDPEKMPKVAEALAGKNNGENKFLESVVVWLDITAPRYFWQQFDTYRIGVTKQSQSTMHTVISRPLTESDFEVIDVRLLPIINEYIAKGNLEMVKALLPEGFLQRRVVCTNYKAIQHMMRQRANHKLQEWYDFCMAMTRLEHQELL